jgi:DNA-binding MarR family transcriptional regulator
MNAQNMTEIKQQEYDLLSEIAQDSLVTQANLSKRLGMAVGSVNWYIKRLIKRGYVKVSHLDRTRLKYDLTPEGMSVFSERAMQYAKDSLTIYKSFRQKAKEVVGELKQKDVSQAYLEGDDEIMDILRLTCLEAGIVQIPSPEDVVLKFIGQEYKIVYMASSGESK